MFLRKVCEKPGCLRVLRRMLIQRLQKELRRRGRRDSSFHHDILRIELFPVERLVGVIVRAVKRTLALSGCELLCGFLWIFE